MIAAVAVGISGAAAYAATEQSSDAGAGFGLHAVQMPKTMPAALTAEFGVFRREARPGDSLEGIVADDSSFVRELGMNPALARRIPAAPGQTSKVWVVPIADGTCLLFLPPDAIGPGGGCGPMLDPNRDVGWTWNRDGSVDVLGMVRDGVASAEAVFADGTTTTRPVTDNVYVFHLQRRPQQIRLVDPQQGRVTVSLASS